MINLLDEPWKAQGACNDADPDLFFHPEGERGQAKRERIAAAKAVCAECPVLAICREKALERRERFGIWGGMSETEREAAAAGPRPNGRPRRRRNREQVAA